MGERKSTFFSSSASFFSSSAVDMRPQLRSLPAVFLSSFSWSWEKTPWSPSRIPVSVPCWPSTGHFFRNIEIVGTRLKRFSFFSLHSLRRRWLFVVIVVGFVNLILAPAPRHAASILGSGHARVLVGDIHTKKEEADLGWKWIVSLLKFTSEHFFTAFTVGCFCIRV